MIWAVLFISVLITPKKETREKLSASAIELSGEWYDDELGWISSGSTLISGLQSFYEDTGIQPYLLICEEMNGRSEDLTDEEAESYLEALYDSLFSDEAHLIYAFMEYEVGYGYTEYRTYIYTGSQARLVMDEDAMETMYEITDRLYYDSSLSDDEFFSEIFNETPKEIMKREGHAKQIVLVAIPVILIAIFLILKKKERDEEHKRRLREILETPIGEDPEEAELKEKYKDAE